MRERECLDRTRDSITPIFADQLINYRVLPFFLYLYGTVLYCTKMQSYPGTVHSENVRGDSVMDPPATVYPSKERIGLKLLKP